MRSKMTRNEMSAHKNVKFIKAHSFEQSVTLFSSICPKPSLWPYVTLYLSLFIKQ